VYSADADLVRTLQGQLARGRFLNAATARYPAAARHWDAVVPVPVLLAAAGVALLVGAVAGLYPALRAARLVPAEALRL
jgi:putative ABC transport system permease protein